jgi:hypothetical protein
MVLSYRVLHIVAAGGRLWALLRQLWPPPNQRLQLLEAVKQRRQLFADMPVT